MVDYVCIVYSPILIHLHVGLKVAYNGTYKDDRNTVKCTSTVDCCGQSLGIPGRIRMAAVSELVGVYCCKFQAVF